MAPAQSLLNGIDEPCRSTIQIVRLLLMLFECLVQFVSQINSGHDCQLHGGRVLHVCGQRVHTLIHQPREFLNVALFPVAANRVPMTVDLNLEGLAH